MKKFCITLAIIPPGKMTLFDYFIAIKLTQYIGILLEL